MVNLMYLYELETELKKILKQFKIYKLDSQQISIFLIHIKDTLGFIEEIKQGRYESIGKNGFGYDPLFYYSPMKKTFAQMSSEEKNEVSHRAKALAKLREDFNNVLGWLEENQ